MQNVHKPLADASLPVQAQALCLVASPAYAVWQSVQHGVTQAVETAKRHGEWLIFNLFRRDAITLVTPLLGKPTETLHGLGWTVQSARGETWQFGVNSEHRMWAYSLCAEDEPSPRKLETLGLRLVHLLSESIENKMDKSYRSVVQKASAYPNDVYRKSTSEALVKLEDDIQATEGVYLSNSADSEFDSAP